MSVPLGSVAQLVDFVRGGEKPPEAWRIGTEHEKIGLRREDLSPVPYAGERGIAALLEGVASDDDWVRVRATVPNSIELQTWLRGLGEHVEVIKPVALRREFCELAHELADLYGAE